MSKTRVQELVGVGDRLFTARQSLTGLWQEIADNFYPERATFTVSRTIGADFSAHLMSGFPAKARRDLANSLSAMLRPRQKLWAPIKASDDRVNEDQASRQWLEFQSERMRKFMYEPDAQFVRATKEADHDFVTFGNAVIEVCMRQRADGLLYRTYHLRDCVWSENGDQKIDEFHRKRKESAKVLVGLFPKTASAALQRLCEKEPHREVQYRHIVVPSDMYDAQIKNKARFPFVSIYLDVENDTILEELPRKRLGYVIPRWMLTSDFGPNGISPALMLALPDARLMQAMTVSLLEATEKAANPPTIATMEAIRSDINVFAGGTTWVDKDYDERLGEALRPIAQNNQGLGYGLQMLAGVEKNLHEALFLNRINLPDGLGKDMTAFETQKRIEEYVRNALPLFEPMESNYNGELCGETFETMLERGAFGGPDEMPQALRGQHVEFVFESPLQATAARVKVEAFNETAQLLGVGMKVDPSLVDEVNTSKMFRDAMDGTQAPADWKLDPQVVAQNKAKRAQAMAAQQSLGAAAGASQVVETGAKAIGHLAKAGGVKPAAMPPGVG